MVGPCDLDGGVRRRGDQGDTGQGCGRGTIVAKSGRHRERRRTPHGDALSDGIIKQFPDATPTEEPYAFDALVGADVLIYSFASFAEKRIVAVVFVANGCPTVRSLETLLQQFQREYEDRGVQLVLINSNNSAMSPRDTYAAVVERARESEFAFPYLKDDSGSVARRFGAVTTPHAFVLDERRRVRYRAGSPTPARPRP